MKTKQHKEFRTVTFFRRVKEQISRDLKGLTFKEQKEYFTQALAGKSKVKNVK